MSERSILWRALAWPGCEHLRLGELDNAIVADGLIVAGGDQGPFRFHYHVTLDKRWRFRRLEVFDPYATPSGSVEPMFELIQSAGGWNQCGFESSPELNGCTDIDITASPFTNTLPIRRLDLDVGESSEIDVAYVWVPEMVLDRKSQRYTRLEPEGGFDRYRFESLDSGFAADITVDDWGLVMDYPGLFDRG